MNIGLYFGSFNPVHVGHLIIASHFANNTNLDRYGLSPQNPANNLQLFLNEYHRLHLIKYCNEGETKIKASGAEFKLPKPSIL